MTGGGVLGRTLSYVYEDSIDGDPPLGPNSGGQNYDAEYLGFFATESKYWIGIASGQRRDNGFDKFGLGDIRLYFRDTSATEFLFGVETGMGDMGASPYTYSREEGSEGRTYNLYPSGYTNTVSTTSDTQRAGDVLATPNVSDWRDDPIEPYTKTQIVRGDRVGTADYIFDYGLDLGEHSFIELSIDRGMFASDLTLTSVGWSPACGNDLLLITNPPHAPIPEPGSVVVWALLSLTVGAYAWRRKRMTNAV